MDMLTSNGNQYLRPEYLTPLPTTLDAKKSPLALLAQTCSQIGADPPSTKSLLNSLTASARNSGSGGDHSENERSASSSSSSGTSTSHSTSTSLSHSKKKSSGNKSMSVGSGGREKSEKSHSKVNHSLNSNSSSTTNTTEESTRANNSNSGGMSNEKNVTTYEQADDKGSTSGAKTSGCSSTNSSNSTKTTSRTGTPSNIIATTTTGNTSPGSTSTNPGNKSPVSALSSSNTLSTTTTSSKANAFLRSSNVSAPSPPDTFMSKSLHESSSSSIPINRPSPPASKDKLNLTGPDFSASSILNNNNNIKSQSQLVPFPGLYPGLPPPPLSQPCHLPSSSGSAIPPYLHSYARLKAAAAAGSLGQADHHPSQMSSSGGCRDPFCTGCQLGAAGHLSSLAQTSKCPAGCMSCDHHKSSPFGFPLFPGFPHLPPSLASLYSSVHQSNSAASGPSGGGGSIGPSPTQPYVCNWIASDTYCGKRFSSSEELLQHLRSHTNLSSSSGGGGNSEPGTLSSVMDRYGPSHHLSHISRTYPTPPLSPLSSARFHPYSKPGAGLSTMGLPGSFPPGFGPPPGFSALAALAAANNPLNPYYPYSLYGQRLGASGLGHP